MMQQMEAADRAFHNLGMKPTPENVEAEAARKAAVSFIIKRIQVRPVPRLINSNAPKDATSALPTRFVVNKSISRKKREVSETVSDDLA